MEKPVVICVDDENMVLDSLEIELTEGLKETYIIELAESGEDALELFKELQDEGYEIPVIISDYIMPNLKGDELLEEVHKIAPQTLKIMLTGQASIDGVTNAINNAKLYRYIAKPWDKEDLLLTVNQACKSFYQDKLLEEQNIQLKEMNLTLEKKVEERTQELQFKNEEITSSIEYAKYIQNAILPSNDFIKSLIPDSFVYYQPKDIVSGDFYWLKQINDYLVIAVADCTGHGVPGAFMSMLGISFLNEIVTKRRFDAVNVLLNRLRKKVKSALHQSDFETGQNDGMDIGLCVINKDEKTLEYAGAFISLILIRNNEIVKIKGDRQPAAIYVQEKDFTLQKVDLQEGDIFYLFSDGFADQIGGENKKKYMAANLHALLLENHTKPMEEQKELLQSNFNKWCNGSEQVDDVVVMGFRVV